MTDRTQYILGFSVLIFLGVLALIGLTIWILHKLHTREHDSAVTKGDLDKLGDSVEAMRWQNSAEHSTLQHFMRSLHTNYSVLVERFGFLKPKPPRSDHPPEDKQ